MIFGSNEHFDYIYSKIKDDDYVVSFHYNVLAQRIEMTVIPKKYKNVMSAVYLTRKMWEDQYYFNRMVSQFKIKFKKALKSFEERRNFQVSS